MNFFAFSKKCKCLFWRIVLIIYAYTIFFCIYHNKTVPHTNKPYKQNLRTLFKICWFRNKQHVDKTKLNSFVCWVMVPLEAGYHSWCHPQWHKKEGRARHDLCQDSRRGGSNNTGKKSVQFHSIPTGIAHSSPNSGF